MPQFYNRLHFLEMSLANIYIDQITDSEIILIQEHIMRPETLYNRLITITDSEKRYRSGYVDKKLLTFPHICIDGKDVMQFSYEDVSMENNGFPFLVRKHSRFRDYPEHIHDWIEISYMYSGSCTQFISGKAYEMKTGQLLLTAPDTVHTIEPLSENDILILVAIGKKNLTTNFYNRFSSSGIVSRFFMNAFEKSSDHNSFYLFQSENSQRLRVFMEEFLCEYYDRSFSSLDILNDLFSLIISELVNVIDYTSGNNSNGHSNDNVLSILHFIEANYRNISLQDAADKFYLNPNYLSNLLKKRTGYSFNQLVTQQKLSSAERLLKSTDMSVTDVANFVGYQNISYFYRIFKERYNCLPGEYRNRI